MQRLAGTRVRGLRINLYSTHGVAPRQSLAERFAAIAALAGRMGWHVQVIAELPVAGKTTDMLAAAPVPVVIDHYGLPGGFTPASTEGGRLLELVRPPHVWVKLSAPYRSTGDALGGGAGPGLARARCWRRRRTDASGAATGRTRRRTKQQPGGAAPLPYRPLDYGAVVAGFRAALPDAALADG